MKIHLEILRLTLEECPFLQLVINASVNPLLLTSMYNVASENGLLGSSTFEAAQIISISEHLKELMTAFRALVAWGQEPSSEILDKWFDGGATDVEGPAVGADRSSRYLKWWMGRIEATLGDAGFAVGDKLSLADVLIYETFAEHLKDEEAGNLPKFRREPFCSKERTDRALANHPKLKASCEAVASNANLQKWLKIRGTQAF